MSREKQRPGSGGSSRRVDAPRTATEVAATETDADQVVRAPSADGGQGGPPHQEAAPRLVRLAAENQRLAEENRGLKAEQRARCISLFLAELREGGQLTPAMEQAGAGAALSAAEESGALVQFADGTSAPLGRVLQAVLKAVPPSAVRRDYAREFLDAPPAPALSESERRIAATLGLSAEEYAAISRQ